MKKNKKAVILGATGFTGRELIKLLTRHPAVELAALYSRSSVGEPVNEVHDSLQGICGLTLQSLETPATEFSGKIVFSALPHMSSAGYIKNIKNEAELVIDLSADYRFNSPEEYKKWYGEDHQDPENLPEAVYALPEINRQDIPGHKIIANPGCYATSVILALYPLLKNDIIKMPVFADAKSGVSGAGKKLADEYLYHSRYENLTPYNVNTHRHMGEIMEFLSLCTDMKFEGLVFCPHLIPMERGILSNIYAVLKDQTLTQDDIYQIYNECYGNEKFIRIVENGKTVSTKDVLNTNNCRIGFKHDKEKGALIVMSALDNLIKGASGQAVQNMNAAMGWDESWGLV